MVSITVQRTPGTASGNLRRRARRVRDAVAFAVAMIVTPHKASLARLADMPLTVLGTAGIDFSAFHVAHALGWLVTGVSLMVIEHMISDSDDGRPA